LFQAGFTINHWSSLLTILLGVLYVCVSICLQDLLKHVEAAEQSTETKSQQSTDTRSSAHDSVSTVQNASSRVAIDPKYVQLLGDKATVSLNILVFPTVMFAVFIYLCEHANHSEHT